LAIEGSEWVIVALLAGSFVSDPDKLEDRVRSVAKAVEQFNRLSAQAKKALDRSMKSLEEDKGSGASTPETEGSLEGPEAMTLIDLAHRLGLTTEGKTAEQIADDIAGLAAKATEK